MTDLIVLATLTVCLGEQQPSAEKLLQAALKQR
jgi:hypothetical protein